MSCLVFHSNLLARLGLNSDLTLGVQCSPYMTLWPPEEEKDVTAVLVSSWEASGAHREAAYVSGQYMDGWAFHSPNYVPGFMFMPPCKWETTLPLTENFFFPWIIAFLLFIILSWNEWRSCVFKSSINPQYIVLLSERNRGQNEEILRRVKIY